MSDPGGSDRAAPPDLGEPSPPLAPIRGVVIVVALVVIGLVLLPSATRGSSSPSPTSLAGTTGPTTTRPHGPTTTTTTVPPPSPAEVHVLVANGSGVTGAAGAVTAYLVAKGYGTLSAANATAKVTTTSVYPVAAADLAGAREVAKTLGLPATAVQTSGAPPVASDAGASVVVVIGPEVANRFATPTSSTTTTAG